MKKIFIFTFFIIFFFIDILSYISSDDIAKVIEKYNIATFESINFKDLTLVKKAENNSHYRMVYYDKNKHQYIKIWSKDYKCIEDFIEALIVGFYDDIAPIKSIIFSQTRQFCLGYITNAKEVRNLRILADKKRILESNVQNLKYQNFFNLLKEKVKKHNIIYLDLTLNNLVFDQNYYYIADLECVINIKNIDKVFNRFNSSFNDIMHYCPSDYSKFIFSLIKEIK